MDLCWELLFYNSWMKFNGKFGTERVDITVVYSGQQMTLYYQIEWLHRFVVEVHSSNDTLS